ncbi:hypothetical protein MRB53_040868 [Persea americana]|nr:hypothetical protein MRB53_040868 [Persea americana]
MARQRSRSQHRPDGQRRPSVAGNNSLGRPLPRSLSNPHGRPMPKTFQDNTIVPNKSVMVEEDDGESEDGVAPEDDASRSNHVAETADRAGVTSSSNDLEAQLQSAKELNATLTAKLEKLRAGSAEPESRESLLKELETQRAITEEVREEAYASLQDMKQLVQEHAATVQANTSVHDKVVSLTEEVETWKQRYAAAQAHAMEQDHRIEGLGLGIKIPQANAEAKARAFHRPDGLVPAHAVARFQIALTDLLAEVHAHEASPSESTRPKTSPLEAVRVVVACVREATSDVETKRAGALVSASNTLVAATGVYARGEGIAPRGLVDAAACGLTARLVELCREVGVKEEESLDL